MQKIMQKMYDLDKGQWKVRVEGYYTDEVRSHERFTAVMYVNNESLQALLDSEQFNSVIRICNDNGDYYDMDIVKVTPLDVGKPLRFAGNYPLSEYFTKR